MGNGNGNGLSNCAVWIDRTKRVLNHAIEQGIGVRVVYGAIERSIELIGEKMNVGLLKSAGPTASSQPANQMGR